MHSRLLGNNIPHEFTALKLSAKYILAEHTFTANVLSGQTEPRTCRE
jgi:hypothetical protein